MRHFLRKPIALALCTLLLFPACAGAQSAPSPKEEVIYANLRADGGVERAYAVNILTVQSGVFADYGRYSDVRNMNTTDALTVSDDRISGTSAAETLYYEGMLNNAALPWTVRIRYRLNGRVIAPAALGGKSGALEIEMHIAQNDACGGDFYDTFALQIACTLDTELCDGIRAEGATIANVGRNKQLTYTVLPGKGLVAAIYANVRDFSMEPITLNGVLLSLDLDIDEDAIDTSDLSDKITALQDGADTLCSGAGDVRSGVTELYDGAGELCAGMDALYDGTGTLQNGADKLCGGTGELYAGIATLAGNSALLQSGAQQIADGVLASANAQLKAALGATAPTLSWRNYQSELAAIAGVTDAMRAQAKAEIATATGLSGVQLDALLILCAARASENPTRAECESTISSCGYMLQWAQSGQPAPVDPSIAAAARAALTAAQSGEGASAICAFLTKVVLANNSGLQSQIASLLTSLQGVESFLAGLYEYTAGVSAAAAGAGKLCEGAGELRTGAETLHAGAADARSGACALRDGVHTLYDGTAELYDGTAELVSETAGMDTEMHDKISEKIEEAAAEYSGKAETPVSFLSPRNTGIKSVQFVLRTARIEAAKAPAVEVAEEAPRTFWQKLRALFDAA